MSHVTYGASATRVSYRSMSQESSKMWRSEWTEPRLQELFRRYDREFFDGRLTGWTVRMKKPHSRGRGAVDFAAFTDDHAKEILLDPLYCVFDRLVESHLLHEMAHAASGDAWHHKTGPWYLEMKRLEEAGAPVGRSWKKTEGVE